MSKHAWLAVILALCLGCGEGEGMTGGSGGSAGAGGSGGSGGDGGTGGSFSVTWGPATVRAETESTQCVIKSLGNTEPIHVHELHNVLGATSHHFIVYRVSDTFERPDPFPCTPFLDTLNPDEGAPLMITQRADDRLTLPEGVAYTLEPNQMVRLELHYINVSASDQTAEATSTFLTIPENEVEHRADVVFMGDGDISIPAGESDTLGPTFIRPPSLLNGVSYFAITGHEHQWGTNVYVETAASAGSAGIPVYDVPNFQWDEPATVTHDPPFTVPDGGGFKLTCDWFNGSNRTVGFGTSVNDEMCFFWAYYFPSKGSVVCINNVFGFNFCCPGDAACDFIPF